MRMQPILPPAANLYIIVKLEYTVESVNVTERFLFWAPLKTNSIFNSCD